jgi:hypothetical protein
MFIEWNRWHDAPQWRVLSITLSAPGTEAASGVSSRTSAHAQKYGDHHDFNTSV